MGFGWDDLGQVRSCKTKTKTKVVFDGRASVVGSRRWACDGFVFRGR